MKAPARCCQAFGFLTLSTVPLFVILPSLWYFATVSEMKRDKALREISTNNEPGAMLGILGKHRDISPVTSVRHFEEFHIDL